MAAELSGKVVEALETTAWISCLREHFDRLNVTPQSTGSESYYRTEKNINDKLIRLAVVEVLKTTA